MLIVWIKKANKGTAEDDAVDAFRRYDEAKKSLRRAHPDPDTARAGDIVMGDGNLLATIQGVEMGDNVQN